MNLEESKTLTEKQILERNNEIISQIIDVYSRAEVRTQESIDFEQKIWEEVKKETEGKRHFKIEQINNVCERLGIDPLVKIICTPKNTGKTTGLYDLINRQIDMGKKVVYMRMLPNELDESAAAIIDDNKANFFIKKTSNLYYIFRKKRDKEGKLIANHSTRIGRATDISKCNAMGAATSYQGTDLIVLDEICSYNNRKLLSLKSLGGFAALPSTLIRDDNDNLRIWGFGNNVGVNKAFLEFYQIQEGDSVRYMVRDGVPILYINTGEEIYSGFKEQKGLARHAPADFVQRLKSNSLSVGYRNIISSKDFNLMEGTNNFLFPWLKDETMWFDIRVSYSRNPRGNTRKLEFYAVRVQPISIFHKNVNPNCKIFSSNIHHANMYWFVTYWEDATEVFIELLDTLKNSSKLYFYDVESAILTDKIIVKEMQRLCVQKRRRV